MSIGRIYEDANYKPTDVVAKAREWGILPESALKMRIRYLIAEAALYEERFGEVGAYYAEHFREEIGELKEMLARYEKRPEAETSRRIPDDLVAEAEKVPITQLIAFDRTGKAKAPCHDDKNPSLHWDRKHNRAHCFPCGKSWNTINWCMDQMGMSFREAVRHLIGRVS